MKKIINAILNLILPIILIVAALLTARYMLANKPEVKKVKPQLQARLVTVEQPVRGCYNATIEAMGTATAAKKVTITPEVSGKVDWVSQYIVPGEMVEAGQSIVRIEDTNYQIAFTQAKSAYETALADMMLEEGNGLVAKTEYKLLGEKVSEQDKNLVLRVPQMNSAKANVASKKAAMEKAEKDIERCDIKVPFNALVENKFIDPGAYANTSTSIVELSGTDSCWIEVLVAVKQLKWIKVPSAGNDESSYVRVFNDSAWNKGQFREGRVLKMAGSLEDSGRMARLIVEVKDPFCKLPENKNKPIILFGSYLRCTIEGIDIENVFKIDRVQLHDNDTLWVMNASDNLEIRKAIIEFKEQDYVLLSGGIEDGENVVSSNISAPVEGMLLRVNDTREVAANLGGRDAK